MVSQACHWQLIPLAVNGRPRLPLASYTTGRQWSAKTTTDNLYHWPPMVGQDYHWQLIPLAINGRPRLPLATYTTGCQWSAKTTGILYHWQSMVGQDYHWQLIPLAVSGRPRLPLASYTTGSNDRPRLPLAINGRPRLPLATYTTGCQWSVKTSTGNLYHCQPMASQPYHWQPIPLKRNVSQTYHWQPLFSSQNNMSHCTKEIISRMKIKLNKGKKSCSISNGE